MTPEHIDSSIARALQGESGLDPEVLKIGGFSTPTMRHLFNNLCHLEGISYLEVGVFKGASFIAAFNNNPIHAVGIDDFSQDFSQGDIRTQLHANLEQWKGSGKSVAFVERDCFDESWTAMKELFDATFSVIHGFGIFCYDGHHDTLPTAKALPAFFNMLADRFIYIVDDIHWSTVAAGVQMGFETLAGRVKIEQEWKLSGKRRQDDLTWHNGLSLFLCEKIK